MVNWEAPKMVLSNAFWCWHSLLINYPLLRDPFVHPQLFEIAWGAFELEWEICPSFENCPLCPILHCAEVLFAPPHPPHFIETFPYQWLCHFACSPTEELQLLAFSVIHVITSRCLELVPVLLANGLNQALVVALEASFEVKFMNARIAADLMFVSDIEILIEFLQSIIFSTALECVPQFEFGEVKTILRALVFGIRKVAECGRLGEVTGGIADVVGAMIEEFGEVDDPEASAQIGYLAEAILS
jgi:hypothetical protein